MDNRPTVKPPGAGKSSFDLIDPETVFGELQLKKGSTFLDMACGPGKYAIAASEIIENEGLIVAIDLWEEAIASLRQQVSVKGIKNIQAIVADVSMRLPVEDDSVDVCLLATVLHDLVPEEANDGALREAARVLNPQGSLAVLEFKKINGPPGPSIRIRLTPQEVENLVIPHGFRKERFVEVGPYNYLLMFSLR